MDGYCSEIVSNETNKTLLTLDGFEIKLFDDSFEKGYIVANIDG